MKLNEIIFDQLGRLRSGWRFAIFAALFILFTAATGAVIAGLQSNGIIEYGTGTPGSLVIGSAAALGVALGVGWFCGKYLEKLPFRAIGAWFTQGWFKNWMLGLVVGGLTVSLAAILAIVPGGVRFERNTADAEAIASTLLASFFVFFIAAAFEEALFRGYILQTFARSGLSWFAIILTSVFFAVVHLNNPNANSISSLNTGLAGIWFGVAYLKTRDLWFVTGLHLMWNWTLGAVYGIEVSGLTELVKAPLLKEIDTGPAWLTGGDYGLEGGVVATIALLASIVVVWYLPFLKADPELLVMTSPGTNASRMKTAQDA